MLTLRRFSFDPLEAFDRWTPVIDVEQGAEATRITAEIPGFKPEHVDVSIEGNLLTIRGTKGEVSFTRGFTVPATVDAAAITANYEHGVLTVTLPRAEAAKARQIPIK